MERDTGETRSFGATQQWVPRFSWSGEVLQTDNPALE
jgi:hypothetical protein